MSDLSDYECKKIKKQIILARWSLHLFGVPLLGPYVQRKVQEKVNPFQLRQGDMEYVSGLIRDSRTCAAGERVCASLSRGSPVTESVFPDELADVMVRSGQARNVSGGEAIAILGKYLKESPDCCTCIRQATRDLPVIPGRLHLLEPEKGRSNVLIA